MLPKVKIIKANGERAVFKPEKLENSLRRSGVDKLEAIRISEKIAAEIKEGATTRDIYQKAFQMVKKESRAIAARYSLKQALLEMGPTGYPFEQLIGRILETQGYQVTFPSRVRGRCIEHEIDVVAEREGEKIMVEAKFHNQPGFRTDAKTAMYVRGRFEDLAYVESNGFTKGWLVTNTKLTTDALLYTSCAGITAIGWDYPKDNGVQAMIEHAGLHPVTALVVLSREEKQRLLEKNIVVCTDILKREKEARAVLGKNLERVKQGVAELQATLLTHAENK